MKDVVLVVDLQFGSTGKGQIAGTIGRKWQPDTVVCANGPNAGHTYKWTEGANDAGGPEYRSIMHTVMPVGAVLPSVRNILLGPGAVVSLERLEQEIITSADLLAGKRLIIHPNASVVTADHREREKALVTVGSTMKGTAEAVIEKMRRLQGANIARNWSLATRALETFAPAFDIVVDEQKYNDAVDSSNRLLVEGAQGASLSMHSRFYPHCTSRDVSINQIWADCRLPARPLAPGYVSEGDLRIIGVCRTYPIRVANRLNEQGDVIGYSGGCYPDQHEITWASIGREPELTTVTKLPRRLFTFSTQQILESVRYNAPTSIALTFCDYLPSHNVLHPDAPDRSLEMKKWVVDNGALISPCVESYIRRLEAAAGCEVDFVSFGPTDRDIFYPVDKRLEPLLLPWGSVT